MRADLEKKPEESDIDWMDRLHGLILKAGSVDKADMEVVTILINRFPLLLTELSLLRDTVADARRSQAGLLRATLQSAARCPLMPVPE